MAGSHDFKSKISIREYLLDAFYFDFTVKLTDIYQMERRMILCHKAIHDSLLNDHI